MSNESISRCNNDAIACMQVTKDRMGEKRREIEKGKKKEGERWRKQL